MPIHGWNHVIAGTFHDFHLAWIAELRRTLNAGALPEGYYVLVEKLAGQVATDVLTLQDLGGGDTAAAGRGKGRHGEDDDAGGDVAVATAPPRVSVRESYRIHVPRRPPAPAGYSTGGPAGGPVTCYVEPTAVGTDIIDMPLFLDPGHYVNTPLETTYRAAYEGVPERWRRVIEGRG